ncbi:MAG TPA: VWA domain-containing protein [Candidatus Limnocylindrales bacterium]|nr:VWA domain-containing protein [Candidatus Limnocylindrales bacterium]
MAEVPFSGERVDGRRLLAQAVGFGRALRSAGLQIDLASEVDFARALTLVDLTDRADVRAAGAAVFVRRRDDRQTYDRVFDRWWRQRRRLRPSPPPAEVEVEDAASAHAAEGDAAPVPGDERVATEIDPRGMPIPGGDDDLDEAPLDRVIVAPDAYSRGEVLRQREFDRMTPAELRDAERLVDLLTPRLERRRTRRYELHHHGTRLAPRAMFRRNLGTGGELYDWEWQRPTTRPRPLVVLCDISGSMERHSRLLLRFIQALSAASAVRTESFVFGTRLTRVTRLLRDRDRDRALARVADSVADWAGGTRIGESFREFNLRWARRTLRSSGIVIVVSDGWDRGDPKLVGVETARLRRSCHRLIWLNPLAGTPGYRPLAAGMAAAYPFIDDFLAAGTIASLERLGEILAGMRAPGSAARVARTGGVGAAAAEAVPYHAALAAARPADAAARPLRLPESDASVARPLD